MSVSGPRLCKGAGATGRSREGQVGPPAGGGQPRDSRVPVGGEGFWCPRRETPVCFPDMGVGAGGPVSSTGSIWDPDFLGTP